MTTYHTISSSINQSLSFISGTEEHRTRKHWISIQGAENVFHSRFYSTSNQHEWLFSSNLRWSQSVLRHLDPHGQRCQSYKKVSGMLNPQNYPSYLCTTHSGPLNIHTFRYTFLCNRCPPEIFISLCLEIDICHVTLRITEAMWAKLSRTLHYAGLASKFWQRIGGPYQLHLARLWTPRLLDPAGAGRGW